MNPSTNFVDSNFFKTYSSEVQYVQCTVDLIDTKTGSKKSYMLRHFEEEVCINFEKKLIVAVSLLPGDLF